MSASTSRRGIASLVGLGAFAVSLAAAPHPAAAYVRSTTPQGCTPVYWAQSCLYIQPDADGVSDLPMSEIERIVQESITSWQTRIDAGSFIKLSFVSAKGPREVSQTDGLQVIKFRRTTWCRPAKDAADKPTCYDPAAAAVTTVTFVNKPMDKTQDGRVIDADIELNAVNNRFYDADQATPSADGRSLNDLWNTLTHEIGHLMGLEHTCRRGTGDSIASCTVDDKGNPVMMCSTVEQGRLKDPALQTIYDGTMYPTATQSEIKKRIPKADDLAAIINTYPQSKDPGICRVPEAANVGGCAAAPPLSAAASASSARPLAATGALSLLALGLLSFFRRRRARAA